MLLGIGAFIEVNDSLANGLAIYRDGQWYGWPILGQNYHPQSSSCTAPTSVTSYNNKLVFATTEYTTDSAGNHTFYHIRAWNYNSFDTLGRTNSSSYRLAVIQGELYAYGWFSTINGMPCRGLAKWDGTNWLDLNPPFGYGGPSIGSICLYDNKLWVGGNFGHDSLDYPYSELAYLDLTDSIWHDINGGIKRDALSSVGSLIVYNNELYIGGAFRYDYGNAGHNVMKWDGSKFVDVGGGLFGEYYAFSTWAYSKGFIEFQGDLWIGGGFEWVGGIKQTDFGIWNGEEWCVTGDSTYPSVKGFAVFQDSLYMLTRHINGDTMNSVAKWVGGSYRDTCGTWPLWPHGTNDVPDSPVFKLYPNPASDMVFIQYPESSKPGSIEVCDMSGRVVLIATAASNSGAMPLEIGSLHPGSYLIRIISTSGNLLGHSILFKV